MRGAIPPLPSTPSWRGAQLKHRDIIIIIIIIVVVVVVIIIIIIIIITNWSTALRILGRMEDTASGYGGLLRMY
jgi:hypothetical protein